MTYFEINRLCPVCKQEVSGFVGTYMLAIEKPYRNIMFHLDCYKQNYENIAQILQETVDLWYNLNYNDKISRKNKGKGVIK